MRIKHKPSGEKKSKIRVTVAQGEDTLLKYLIAQYPECSRTTVKSWLTHRQIAINRIPVTAYDTPINRCDEILINLERGFGRLSHPRLKIVYEDEYIVVVDKGYGLLSVATDKIKDKTAFRILSDYLKENDPAAKLFVVHRLDRDTSGLLMYAKSEKIQSMLQRSWNELVTDRRYAAVIAGCIEPAEGDIISFLAENSVHQMYSTDDPQAGRYAHTRYETLQSNGKYSLLSLQLETGRKNQIRVHLSEKGHPITGDRRYGSHDNPAGRLALHAYRLRFIHPITRRELTFESPIPEKFKKITQ